MKVERRPTTGLYPLPLMLVTAGAGAEANIITIAWGGVLNGSPPMVGVAVRASRHSYGMLCETREFVVNVPRSDQARIVDLAGVESGRDVDKFAAYGLTATAAAHVAPPLIEECPVNLECVVRHQLALGSHDLFIGEVLAVHYDEALLDEKGRVRPDALRPLVYVEGEYWSLNEPIGRHGFAAPAAGGTAGDGKGTGATAVAREETPDKS